MPIKPELFIQSASMIQKKIYRLLFAGILVLSMAGFLGCFPQSSSPENPPQIMYHVRYDTCMVNHRAVRDHLTMVPAYEEFRMERFRPVEIPCSIRLSQDFDPKELRTRAIESALKAILEKNGLIHVTTFNTTTVVSYEALVRSPFLVMNAQNPANPQGNAEPVSPAQQTIFSCTAQFEFSPLRFPNEWAEQRHKKELKQKLATMWGLLP